MKKFSTFAQTFAQRLFPLLLIIAACLASFSIGAAVQRAKPAPDSWVGRYRTNYFTLNQDAKPGVINGTNVYTGATTNVSLYGGSTNAGIRLQIVNGIVTGVVAY